MLDIFNKKKTKKLNQEIEDYQKELTKARIEIKCLKAELEAAKKHHKETQHESFEERENLIRENEKLIDWIKQILKVAHVCETRNTLDVITIPISRTERDICAYGSVEPFHQEDIIIPTIRFTTVNERLWR